MKAAAAVAGVVSVLLGLVAMCAGAFLAFPLVISVLLSAIGLRPNSFAVVAMVAALLFEVAGLGLVLVGPRVWSRLGRRGEEQGSDKNDEAFTG